MRIYFFILSALYLLVTLQSLWQLAAPDHWLSAVFAAANIVLFSLSLIGSYALAFRKRIYPVRLWGNLWPLTLIAGMGAMVLGWFGHSTGIPSPETDSDYARLLFIFFPYFFFAFPVLLYTAMRKQIRDDLG
jgi:hypothetical protein